MDGSESRAEYNKRERWEEEHPDKECPECRGGMRLVELVNAPSHTDPGCSIYRCKSCWLEEEATS